MLYIEVWESLADLANILLNVSQTFTECVLSARHCSKSWDVAANKRQALCPRVELAYWRGKSSCVVQRFPKRDVQLRDG